MPRRRGGPPVVVDSSAWIDLLRGGATQAAQEVRRLLRSGRALLTGVVLAELLQGVHDARERNDLADALRGVEYLHLERSTYEYAGQLGALLRSRRRVVPLSDLLVAAAALERSLSILTTDPHFAAIPGVRLHEPR